MLGKPLGSWSPVVLSSHCHPTIHPPSNIQGAATGLPESVGQGCLTAKMKQLKHTDFFCSMTEEVGFQICLCWKREGNSRGKKKKLFVCHGLWKVVVCADPGLQNKLYQIPCEILNKGTQMNQIS